MLRSLCQLPRQLTRTSGSVRTLAVTPRLLGDLTPDTKSRIDELVKSNDVVLFMKGSPEEPLCGFSRKAKTVLQYHEIPFKHFDVLSDEEVRAGIKEYSDWPTIPQVFVKGTFIGGSDILIQLHTEGTFHEEFEKFGIKSKYSGNQPSD